MRLLGRRTSAVEAWRQDWAEGSAGRTALVVREGGGYGEFIAGGGTQEAERCHKVGAT